MLMEPVCTRNYKVGAAFAVVPPSGPTKRSSLDPPTRKQRATGGIVRHEKEKGAGRMAGTGTLSADAHVQSEHTRDPR